MNISSIIINILNSLAALYVASKFLNSNLDFKNYKFYLILVMISTYTLFTAQVTQSFVRTLILLQVFIICNFILHTKRNKNIEEIMIVSLITWILLLFTEIITVIITYIICNILGIVEYLNIFANNIMTIFIIVFFVSIVKIKKIFKLITKMISYFINLKFRFIVFACNYIALILSSTVYFIYFDLSLEYKLTLFIIILIEYIFGIYYVFIERRQRSEIKKQLDSMIMTSSNYEKLLEDSRINNHENKNQLIIVKSLIDPNNKEALDYLQNLIVNNFKEDNNILLKVAKVPVGGLRGLIYYKLLLMHSLDISYILNVSKEVDNTIFKNISLTSLQNYYKAVGVILDNAIDAVKSLKEKAVVIEMYINANNFIINLSNEYNKNVDFENLGKNTQTTKDGEHGYGLQLVNKILNQDKNLSNEKEVIGDIFIQKMGIVIKK